MKKRERNVTQTTNESETRNEVKIINKKNKASETYGFFGEKHHFIRHFSHRVWSLSWWWLVYDTQKLFICKFTFFEYFFEKKKQFLKIKWNQFFLLFRWWKTFFFLLMINYEKHKNNHTLSRSHIDFGNFFFNFSSSFLSLAITHNSCGDGVSYCCVAKIRAARARAFHFEQSIEFLRRRYVYIEVLRSRWSEQKINKLILKKGGKKNLRIK